MVRFLLAAAAAFFGTYILKLGLLDGATGYRISRLAGYHARRKHEHLLDLQNKIR